jgi:hypothetical protein
MARPESVQIRVSGTESRHTVLEFSRLLYHLDLVYEVSRLATDPRYRSYQFPEHTFRPLVSPLEPSDRMILLRVRHESPWDLSVLLHDPMALLTGGLGALWLFVQCLERVSTLGLNRRKLKAEIQKVQLEAEKLRREMETAEPSRPTLRTSEARRSIEGPDDITTPTTYFADPLHDDDSLIPPKESMRLYRRLGRRGAQKFYESNVNAIHRLGFAVKDFELGTDIEE